MADTTPEISTFGILNRDLPDPMVDDFMTRHASGKDTPEILKAWETIQSDFPKLARIIRKMSQLRPDEAPTDSQQRSRDLIGMYMLLDRTVLSRQLEQEFQLGEPSAPIIE